MTTNVDRAAAEIRRVDGSHTLGAGALAEALADAGLLIPDLPGPHTVDRYPGSVCWEVCTDPSAAARRHVGVRVDHMHRIKTNITGEATPDEAREAAYALLAAANHAEQEKAMDDQPECPTCGNDYLDDEGYDRVGCDWGPAPAECRTCKKCFCDGSC